MSHECCETSADPEANRWADRADGTQEALETNDRVEDESYEIDGVAVSDFLLQSAFAPGSSAPWDHMNILSSEDGQTSGGYVIERQQGMVSQASADGSSVNIELGHRVEAKRGAATDEAYRRRKNHPASRTSRRGARMP